MMSQSQVYIYSWIGSNKEEYKEYEAAVGVGHEGGPSLPVSHSAALLGRFLLSAILRHTATVYKQ